VGIEPTTFGLKGRCSTTELRPSTSGTILACAGGKAATARSGITRWIEEYNNDRPHRGSEAAPRTRRSWSLQLY
jgi:hypothetical protein